MVNKSVRLNNLWAKTITKYSRMKLMKLLEEIIDLQLLFMLFVEKKETIRIQTFL